MSWVRLAATRRLLHDHPTAMALSVRIAIAAWHLKNLTVGIGRYARELIDVLGRVDRRTL